MNSQISTDSAPGAPANLQPDHDGDGSKPAVAPCEPASMPSKARPMQIRRFFSGLIFSTCGIVLMLTVAAGTLQSFGAQGRLSLPAVGLCMIVGLMLLGGGFGIMATSSPVFDDNEFERMIQSGSLVDHSPDLRRDEGPSALTQPKKLMSDVRADRADAATA